MNIGKYVVVEHKTFFFLIQEIHTQVDENLVLANVNLVQTRDWKRQIRFSFSVSMSTWVVVLWLWFMSCR